MRTPLRVLNNRRGMTLIEIMIVLAIIGSLMAILGQRILGFQDRSKASETKIIIKEVGNKLLMYYQDCGQYPSTDQGLQALIQSPGDACPNWAPEGYLKKPPADAWNRPLIYESDGSNYTLKSLGKDGRDGGEGYGKDITNEDG